MITGIPMEVWKCIIAKITNPHDLARLRAVSKDWSLAIKKILQFADWKKLCLLEIRPFSLLSIISLISSELKITNYSNITNQSFWRDVYFHYQKWVNFNKFNKLSRSGRTRVSSIEKEHVTCCDVWFHLIACGTSQGRVYIYMNPKYRHIHSTIELGNDPIKQVKFWYNGNYVAHIVTLTQSDLLNFWNMRDKKNNNPRQIFLANCVCTGTAHNLYVGSNRTIMKYVLTKTNNINVLAAIELNLYDGEKIEAMNSRESKIFVIVLKERKIRMYIIEDQFLAENGHTLRVQFNSSISPLPKISPNIRVSITLNRNILCTQKNFINVTNESAPAWINYTIPMDSNVFINCVTIHGSYLIFGLTNGNLCFRPLETIFDLSDPNDDYKNAVQVFRVTTSEPIVDIKVVQLRENVNVIAVTTSEIIILEI